MTLKFVQTPPVTLYQGLSSTATEMIITPYPRGIQSNEKLTYADFGDDPTVSIDPKIPGYEEIVSFTGIVDNGNDTATLTGLVRNLIGQDPYTTPGVGKTHGASAVVVFSDNPQMFGRLPAKENDNVFTGDNTFTNNPRKGSTTLASNNDDYITKADLLNAVLGSVNTDQVVIGGTAGENLTAGNIVYFKEADQKWWKADADIVGTFDQVVVAIAQDTALADASVNVLLQGLDKTQTGLTLGAKYYLSNTAGAISTTPGTTEVFLGWAQTATRFIFDPLGLYQPSSGQKAALAGSSGTPSSTNKYITEDDVSSAGASGKVVRLNGNQYPSGDTSLLFSQIYTAGEALTAGDAVSFNPYSQPDGGITHDNKTGATYSNATNQTMSHTVGSGNNRLLIVSVGATSAPSAVSYNSVSMTLVDSLLIGGGLTVYVYSLVAPSTGSNNVSVTGSGIYNIIASSYFNCKQTGTVLSTTKVTASASSISSTGNTGGTGSMIYTVFYGTGLSGTMSGSSTFATKYVSGTSKLNQVNSNQSGYLLFASDTGILNEQQSITVSTTWSGTSGGSPIAGQIQLAIAPFTTPTIGVVKAKSNAIINNEPLVNFIGFANSTVSAGASVAVTVIGVYSGLTGLTTGTDYYIAQTGSVDSDVTITYSGSTGNLSLGTNAGQEYRFGVSFTLTKPALVNKVTLGNLRTSGSPQGGILATIFTGNPTSLGVSTNISTRLAASSVTSSYASCDFNFSNAYLPAGSYCIVFIHDTLSNNNFFQLDRDSTANSAIYTYNSSWSTTNRTNVTIDYSAATFTSGQITNYFYGSYIKKVGTAISSTALLIDKTPKTGLPISKNNTTYTAETDGYAVCVYNSGTAGAASIIANGVGYLGQGATNGDRYTITVPVKKNDIYSFTGSANFYFIPQV